MSIALYCSIFSNLSCTEIISCSQEGAERIQLLRGDGGVVPRYLYGETRPRYAYLSNDNEIRRHFCEPNVDYELKLCSGLAVALEYNNLILLVCEGLRVS